MYGMSKVVSFEPKVKSTMECFFKRLDIVFADKDQVCNFAFWLQAFAFNVIGEITFSKRIGFLEKGEDIDGIVESIWKYFTAASPVSHPPGSGPASKFFERRNHQYLNRLPKPQDLELLTILTQAGISNAMARFDMNEEPNKTMSKQSQTKPNRQFRSGLSKGASDSNRKGVFS